MNRRPPARRRLRRRSSSPTPTSFETRVQGDPRFVEPHFAFVDVPPRGLGLRLGQRDRRALRLIVEPREHLALAHGHAFLDVHLDDLAGDFRRDGRPPARGDVARRIQDRRLRPGLARRHRDDLDFDRPLAREPPPARRRRRQREDGEHEPSPSGGCGRASGSRSSRRAARSSLRSTSKRRYARPANSRVSVCTLTFSPS